MPPDASSASQADAHAALLTELKVDKAIVVGISAGARSAVQLAVRHPERTIALILIVPGTYAPASPVAIEGSRTSALTLWLVNIGADFAWWALENRRVAAGRAEPGDANRQEHRTAIAALPRHQHR
jgi:pimeloyl-ACP methyl ester carboxylesterase